MKKIAVLLAGCGFQDGSEITETVSTLIAIGEAQASYQCYSPEVAFTSKNHLDSTDTETRSTRIESARIARGNVLPLAQLNSQDYDALIIPGGFGVALHLCDWAHKGSRCSVHKEVESVIHGFYQEQKPIGAICIAPALIARVLGSNEMTLTIGDDVETAAEIEKTGAIHENCTVEDFITDRAHRIVTTPAYMYDSASPYQVSQGIKGLIKEVVEMA